jgi:hypothetical protein
MVSPRPCPAGASLVDVLDNEHRDCPCSGQQQTLSLGALPFAHNGQFAWPTEHSRSS